MVLDYTGKDLIVVSDIHGNLVDFIYYLNLWLRDKSNHICFMGDLIHGDCLESDGSLMILDLVRVYIDCPTFHVLMGNHELSQLCGDSVYRYSVNQTEQFKMLVEEEYPNEYTVKYQEYKNLLKLFKPCLRTSNGFFIIHSGINEDYIEPLINGSVDIDEPIDSSNDYELKVITEILWSRPYDDYTEKTINTILKHYNCKYMISGHTNYNGCHIYGNQLIFDSSHNTENKYYLRIKLDKEYENIIDVLKQLERYG